MQLWPETFSKWSQLNTWQRLIIGSLWAAGAISAGIGLSMALTAENPLPVYAGLAISLASVALSITHLTWFFTRKL